MMSYWEKDRKKKFKKIEQDEETNKQKVYAKYVVLTTRYPIMNFPGY